MSDKQATMDPSLGHSTPPELAQAPPLTRPATTQGELERLQCVSLAAHHADFAAFHQEYVTGYIQFADTKASWVFAVTAGMIAYVLTSEKLSGILLPLRWGVDSVLLCIIVALLLASCCTSFLTVAPRFGSAGRSIVFFNAVARRSGAEEYIGEVAALNESSLVRARLEHSFDLSRIAARKFSLLRLSFWTGAAAIIGMVIAFWRSAS